MRTLALLVAAAATPIMAFGQGSSDPNAFFESSALVSDGPASPTYGTATKSFLTLGAWNAQPIDSSHTYNFVNTPFGQGIHRTAGSSFLKVPLQLPNGAQIREVEFNYCDTGASAFTTYLFRETKNGPSLVTELITSTGTPGCVVQTATLETPFTVDNNGFSYNIEMIMGSTDATIVFFSLRVGYFLQVSPAPATATFTDVPTSHPFFRFIEALAAAGITGGCGAGSYCPDNPVTRGQMAVFLSVALGLHFPN